MRKRIIYCIVLAVTLSVTACGNTKNNNTKDEKDGMTNENTSIAKTTTMQEDAEVLKNASKQADTNEDISTDDISDQDNDTEKNQSTIQETEAIVTEHSGFTRGIWWSTGSEDGDMYYQFLDHENGTLLYQDSGMGVGFTYEVNGSEVVFHMGDVESYIPVAFQNIADGYVQLDFENSDLQQLSYQGNMTFEKFKFYSNDELCEMARKYLKMKNGEEAEYAAAVVTESGLIAIQLYDNFDGHNSTAAWYSVDRFTGKGTDSADNEIDLTETLD